jgi:hypothetical protein
MNIKHESERRSELGVAKACPSLASRQGCNPSRSAAAALAGRYAKPIYKTLEKGDEGKKKIGVKKCIICNICFKKMTTEKKIYHSGHS